jgi:glucose/arabinose dehydrogenase
MVREITSVSSTPIATFAAPWAMTFLPDGRLLVSERVSTSSTPPEDRDYDATVTGKISLVTQGGIATALPGLPANIGILDVVLHPKYSTNHLVYFSFVEPGDASTPRVGRAAGDNTLSPAGLAVATATLVLDDRNGPRLDNTRVIWRETPKIVTFPGSGEPGGRLAFSPDGVYLFITAGDRQEFQLVQELSNTLGKVIRLYADGTVPPDNPFVGRTGALPEIWSLGHRNPYGLAFDAAGRLWEHEHGPSGGDELNLIQAGGNYGWPNVSYGSAYTGEKYPNPASGDGYVIPSIDWTPAIAPAGMIFYSGNVFAAWRGDAIVGGLKSRQLVRVHFTGTTAMEAQRIPMTNRIREVEQGPDGAIWVLEDAPTGRLLKLAPIF